MYYNKPVREDIAAMKIVVNVPSYSEFLVIELTVSPCLLRMAREISSASADSGSIERAFNSFANSNIAVWMLACISEGKFSNGSDSGRGTPKTSQTSGPKYDMRV